jgi:hypothetical protein
MPTEEFVQKLAHNVERQGGQSGSDDAVRLDKLYRAAQDACPQGWGHATRLRREVTKARDEARVVQNDLRLWIEKYAVAEERIAALERQCGVLRGYPQAVRAEIHSPHWESYRDTCIRNGLPSNYIDSVDRTTDQMISNLADPASMTPSPVDGRIFIPVQAGKSVYVSALVAKSVDAGYRLVLVLTRPLKVVRDQLQTRLDDGLQPLHEGGFRSYGLPAAKRTTAAQ